MESNFYFHHKYRLVNNNYFIKLPHGFLQVKGIKLKNFTDLELFLHKDSEGKIIISEATSGLRISLAHSRKSVAEKFVEKLIEKHGVSKFRERIEKKIDGKYLSPRYRFIVNPNKQICGILRK